MIRIAVANPAHIRRIANRMREVDRIECEAHGRSPVEALRYSLRTSSEAWTAFTPDGPQAMFGVCPTSLAGRSASAWFLGTDDVRKHPRGLLVIGRRVLTHWRAEFDTLENEVATSNSLAVALLARWGATFGEERDLKGVTFRRFKL